MGGHMMAMRPGDDRLKSHLELYMNADHEYCVKNWVEYIKKKTYDEQTKVPTFNNI